MAFHSFRGHMSLLSPKGNPVLVIGPSTAIEPPVEGRASARMIARSDSIDTLSAKYPWVDLVDKQIFLEGYRAAERQYSNTLGIQTPTR
jgi:hypothetical protein